MSDSSVSSFSPFSLFFLEGCKHFCQGLFTKNVINSSKIKSFELNTINVERVNNFVFKKIFKWSFEPHFIIVVDSAATFTLRKTVIRISGILVINLGSQVLVDCKFNIDIFWGLSQ